MIEKIKEHDVIDPKTGNVIGKIGCDLREIMDKLNEVIDAANELQTQVSILEEHAHPTAKTPDYDDTDDIAEVKNENLYTKSIRMDKEFAEEEMERLQKELIRTRKALDVAVNALKRLEKELYFNNAKQIGHIADSVMSIPNIALVEITALEQKDVK